MIEKKSLFSKKVEGLKPPPAPPPPGSAGPVYDGEYPSGGGRSVFSLYCRICYKLS